MVHLKNDAEFDELIKTLQMYHHDNSFHCNKMTSVELVNKIRSVKISIYLMNTYITDAINVSISLLYKCTFKNGSIIY